MGARAPVPAAIFTQQALLPLKALTQAATLIQGFSYRLPQSRLQVAVSSVAAWRARRRHAPRGPATVPGHDPIEMDYL